MNIVQGHTSTRTYDLNIRSKQFSNVTNQADCNFENNQLTLYIHERMCTSCRHVCV